MSESGREWAKEGSHGLGETGERRAARELPVSPVRCRPLRLDLAFVVGLDASRSIGVGMTPGDASTPEPYFYVTPWPHPLTSERPPLEGGGAWHTDGWFAAVLPVSTVCADADGDAQLRRALAFAHSGVAACRRLLG